MAHETISYLKTHRKRSGLTQQEVASLLGYESSQVVSRFECLNRIPSLRTVIAYQLIFGVPTAELLPSMHREVERETLQRLLILAKRLAEHPESGSVEWKVKFLGEVLERFDAQRGI